MPKIVVRTIVIAAILLPLIIGYVWIRNRPPDIVLVDIPPVNSRGFIAALMETDEGMRLVSIDPEGNLRTSPGNGEIDDREFTWMPDGRRIVFVSNRTPGGSYQIFEWRPDGRGNPFKLTEGASRQHPWFHPSGNYIVYVSQGNVSAVTYPQRATRRVMPPSVGPGLASSEEGHAHDHDAPGHRHDEVAESWERLTQIIEGEAFHKGFVDMAGDRFIGLYDTVRGRVLVLQILRPKSTEEGIAAIPLGGERVEVSFNAQESLAVVSVVNFRFPVPPTPESVPPDRILPDGTVARDFANAVVLVDLANFNIVPMFLSPDLSQDFVYPSISPDGQQVALVYREREDDRMATRGLVVARLVEGGVVNSRPVTTGVVSDPSWSPDGSQIAFIRDGDIWTVQADGTQERNITNGKGRFQSPMFSPMR